jgi:hypothetical protein
MVSEILVHSPWLFDSGPVVGRTSWQHECAEEQAVHLMVAGSREERSYWGLGVTFKGTPPVTYFL